jgi:hypothetical protein
MLISIVRFWVMGMVESFEKLEMERGEVFSAGQ